MLTSIALPVFNEAKILKENVEKLICFLNELNLNYEIIIAEDGSTDNSYNIARELGKKYKKVHCLHSSKRLGKGEAIKRAFEHSKGSIFIFMDVDLSTDLSYIPKLISKINDGYDMVVGSRVLKYSKVERSLKREMASRIYNLLCRFLFGIKLHDMQCGFKCLKKESIKNIIKEVKNKHWFWDTELIIRATKKNMKITEIPIKWKQTNRTKVNFLRDSFYMVKCVLELWYKLNLIKI